jgi:hypothetical protein
METTMPSDSGRYFNWFNRHWRQDWPEVEQTVYEVAKNHARYLGYEVQRAGGGFRPPPGDINDVGPVVRVKVYVLRRSGKHRQPVHEVLTVDVERRGGKFHAKTASVDPDKAN